MITLERMEVIDHHLTQKLIGLVMAIIGGIGFVIARKVLTRIDKASSHAVINSIKKEPSKANVFAASLDIPYSKKENFQEDHFLKLIDYMRSITIVGKYRVLYVAAYERDHLLVFTEISFVDFDINITGNPSDTRKKAYHNFVVKLDREKNRLVVLSNVYSDTTEKFQKEAFLDAVFNGEG